jgi:hypothetical protein
VNSSLGSVLEQIKQCEKFVELCDKILNLEKMQQVRLPLRKCDLEEEKSSLMQELKTVCANQASMEATLNSEEPLVEQREADELRTLIKTTDLQKRLLRTKIDKLSKQIESVDKDAENSARELENLYPAMDKFIQLGFDPDTARLQLIALLSERDRIRKAIKREMSTKK